MAQDNHPDILTQENPSTQFPERKNLDPPSPLGLPPNFQSRSLTLGSIFLLICTTLVVYSKIIYAKSVDNEFVNFDDRALVVNNTWIQDLTLEKLKTIFTPVDGATYQPVRTLSYAIDYRFWKLNPVGYQAVNILLHGVAAIFLFCGLWLALGQLRPGSSENSNFSIALFATLLWVAHPINVESVVWISSRKYGLLAACGFFSFYAYIRSWEGDKLHFLFLILSLLTALLAVLSSPFGVIIPLLFFLYDYCRDHSNNPFLVLKRRILAYIPYLFAGVWILPVLFRALTGGISRGASKDHFMGQPIYTFYTMIRVLLDYVKNLTLPFWLNIRYVDHYSTSILEPKVIISILFLLGLLLFLTYRWIRRDKVPLFCAGWFFLAWLPVSNVIPISTTLADRYMYLPAIGFFLGFSLGLYHISHISFMEKSGEKIFVTLASILLLSLIFLSIERTKVWENSITLWQDSIKKDRGNYLAYFSLGSAYIEKNRFKEGIDHSLKSLEIRPHFKHTHYNLGLAYFNLDDLENSFLHFGKALKLGYYAPAVHNYLGMTYTKAKKYAKAKEHFIKATKSDPNFEEARSNLKKVESLIEQATTTN